MVTQLYLSRLILCIKVYSENPSSLELGKSHSLKKPDVLSEISQIHTVKGRNLEKKPNKHKE